MGGKQGSIVLVVRMWRDDDGIRAVLQTTTRSGETAYASVGALRSALGEILDSWQPESDDAAQVRPLAPE